MAVAVLFQPPHPCEVLRHRDPQFAPRTLFDTTTSQRLSAQRADSTLLDYHLGIDSACRITGKERDSETNLDYFGARYFLGAQGRFTSPDQPLLDQDESDPQSWNLYSYVRNNPLRFFDADGRACVSSDGGKTYQDDNSGGQSCADVEKANQKKKPDLTVEASARYGGGAWFDASGALIGTYPPSVQETAIHDPVPGAVAGYLTLTNPAAGAVVQCATGDCDKTSLAMAMIPGVPGLGNTKLVKLGAKVLKIDPNKPLRAYLAGARLAKGEGFPEHLLGMTANELKAAVAKGVVTPDQVRKIGKVVEQGQRLMEKLGGK